MPRRLRAVRIGMIPIDCHPEGFVLAIRGQPGARRDAIIGEYAGALKVAVTAPPDRGRANEAIIDVLAQAFAIKKSQVRILSGATSRQKRLLIIGMDQTALEERIAAALGP